MLPYGFVLTLRIFGRPIVSILFQTQAQTAALCYHQHTPTYRLVAQWLHEVSMGFGHAILSRFKAATDSVCVRLLVKVS